MIEEFLASWPLFHDSYLAGWAIGVVLALLGVLVVARDQIFVGATVSQASIFGVALGMVVGSWLDPQGQSWLRGEAFLALLGPLFAVAAALAAGGPRVARRESPEAVTGWIYLAAASGSVLLLADSPHGLEEVHRLLASTLIGARPGDVALFAVLTGLTLLVFWRYHAALILLTIDPEMAAAVGLRVEWLGRLVWIWLGVVVGTSVRVSGMIFTFGSLVLPALVAKNVCREVAAMLVVAPVVSLAGGTAAFVVANAWDYPPGQMAVAVQCVLLSAAWVWRALTERN